MTLDTRYEVNHPEVVDESVDGEVLIVHLGTGAYYSSRGTGDLVWQLLARGASPQEVASALTGGSDGDVASSVAAFAAQLVDEGLVRTRTATPEQLPAVSVSDFQPPVLEKFVDMQELLLLDPIHEVEEAGWPNARPAPQGK